MKKESLTMAARIAASSGQILLHTSHLDKNRKETVNSERSPIVMFIISMGLSLDSSGLSQTLSLSFPRAEEVSGRSQLGRMFGRIPFTYLERPPECNYPKHILRLR